MHSYSTNSAVIRLWLVAIAALAVTALLAISPAQAEKKVWTAWVEADVVNVRSGPGTDRKKIGSLTQGTKVFVTAFRNRWCWAKLPDDSWGWIAEWLLEFSYDKGRQLAGGGDSQSTSTSHPPAWIKVTAANVRSGPGLGYDRYGSLPRGTKVYKLSQRAEWIKCKTPGGEGWIRRDLLEFDVDAGRQLAGQAGSAASNAGVKSAKAYINGDKVRLRSSPSTESKIIALLNKGQIVHVFGERGDWKQVTVQGGNTGWVAGWLIKYETNSGNTASIDPLPDPPPDFPNPEYQRPPTVSEKLYAWIDGSKVNVRSGPGTDHPVRLQLGREQKVEVLGADGHWCRIKTSGGDVGWVAGWVISFLPPGEEITTEQNGETIAVKVGWVARPEVNLRAGPGTNYEEIGELVLSTQVIITDQHGDWYKVLLDNGKSGWVAGWLIDTREERIARQEGAPAGSRSSKGSQIIHTALQYLGRPYVRGGESPGGFDCSGFVHYVMGQHGISVSRTSPALFREGRPVSRSQLRPGDVVFFRNTYKRGISHVGLYINANKFIHAANQRRDVTINRIDDSYYGPRYVGARRMY